MLSISNPLSGAGVANYYKEHAQASYYANDLSQPGEWYGRGTDRLKLQGKVDFEIFDRLLRGFDRTGRIPLVQNAGHEKRAQGWDLTFSAPKSVSVLWALAPEDVRQQIAAAHRAAVCQALDYVQDHAAITRRGKGGTRHEQAEVAFALFQHGVSRAQDPQLHIHCVLLNLACRQDGSVGALHSQPLFDEKMATGAVYQARLAAELQQRLNLALQSERKSFRILNVPAELCSHFSKRRRAIVKFLQQHGLAGAVAAKAATLLTRPRKQHLPPERVRAAWIEVGRQFGWGEEQIRELIEQSRHASQERTHAAAAAGSTKSQPQEQAASLVALPGRVTDRSPQPSAPQTELSREASQAEPAAETPGSAKNQRGQSQRKSNQQARDHQQARAEAQAEARARARKEPPSQEPADSSSTTAGNGPRPRRLPGPTQQENQQQQQEGPWPENEGPGEEQENPRQKQTSGQAFQGNTGSAKPHRKGYPEHWLRWEWQLLFPKAPYWSPVRIFKLPRLVVGRPHLRRWGKVRWSLNLWVAELRVQDRRLFRKAPHWNPLRWKELPSLRLVPKNPLEPVIRRVVPMTDDREKDRKPEHGHSH